MDESIVSMMFLWLLVIVYVIAGALDFGAGFWSMVYSERGDTKAGEIANRYLSPSWEVTNVLLVMFVVTLVSFFPKATFTLGTILLIPANIILVLLTIRTAFMVFSHSVDAYRKLLNQISGITGILIPPLLAVVLPVTHGGFVENVNGNSVLLLGRVFSSLSVFVFIGVAITFTLYLSSLFLADYSNAANDKSAFLVYRKNALSLGPISFILGIVLIFTFRLDAAWLYDNMMKQWFWLLLTALVFLIGYMSIRKFNKSDSTKKLNGARIALLTTILQILFVSLAYGKAHLPYLIYPMTVEESFTNLSMYRALTTSYIIATIILLPGFIYHWRLFMRNTEETN